MIVFLIIFIVLCLWKAKFKPSDSVNYMADYMSVDKTMSIKGIFIIIVFFSHFNGAVEYSQPIDIMYFKAFSLIGQRMVTLFLFYSGFGVMESIKKRGMNYIRNIPKVRTGGVIFRFDVAILLYALLNLAIGSKFTLKQFLLSLIGWDSLGNSNWYIFMILAAYLITYAAFEICKDRGNYVNGAVLTFVFTAVLVAAFYFTNVKDRYWYDTVILYALGMFWSLWREKIEKIINKNNLTWLAAFGIICVCEVILMKFDKYFILHELGMILFAAAVLIFSMKISLNNPVLRWCGKNLFGIYILQRIPFILFGKLGVDDFNIYVYFVLSLAVTVLAAWVFEKYVGKLWTAIIKPKNKKSA